METRTLYGVGSARTLAAWGGGFVDRKNAERMLRHLKAHYPQYGPYAIAQYEADADLPAEDETLSWDKYLAA